MKRALLLLAALAAFAVFGYTPVAHTNVVVKDGVTYVQRGALGTADYVVTNVNAATVGRVQSVNGKTGDVVLAAKDVGAVPTNVTEEVKVHLSEKLELLPDNSTNGIRLSVGGTCITANIDTNVTIVGLTPDTVGALPDNYDSLTNNTNFKNAVEEVSPPVELPTKWALANVTNSTGGTVSASDVGARSDSWLPTPSQISALEDSFNTLTNSGNFRSAVSNIAPTAHLRAKTDLNIYVNGFDTREISERAGKPLFVAEELVSKNVRVDDANGDIFCIAQYVGDSLEAATELTVKTCPSMPSLVGLVMTRSEFAPKLSYGRLAKFAEIPTSASAIGGVNANGGMAANLTIGTGTLNGFFYLGTDVIAGTKLVMQTGNDDNGYYVGEWSQFRKGTVANNTTLPSYLASGSWKTEDYNKTVKKIYSTDSLQYIDGDGNFYRYNESSYWTPYYGPDVPAKKLLQVDANTWETQPPYTGIYVKYKLVWTGTVWRYWSASVNSEYVPYMYYDCTIAQGSGKDATSIANTGMQYFTRTYEGGVWTYIGKVALTNDIPFVQGMVDYTAVWTNNTLKTFDGTTTIPTMDYEAVTNTVNAVKAKFYDQPLQVEWTVRMVNGDMKLYATTNVNTSVLNN